MHVVYHTPEYIVFPSRTDLIKRFVGRTQVTKSSYTADEDFSAADQVTEELGEDGEASVSVTLVTLGRIVRERASVAP